MTNNRERYNLFIPGVTPVIISNWLLIVESIYLLLLLCIVASLLAPQSIKSINQSIIKRQCFIGICIEACYEAVDIEASKPTSLTPIRYDTVSVFGTPSFPGERGR